MSASPTDCLFCKIANGDMDVPFVAESAHAVAFNDIQPLASTHVLVVPRRHIESIHTLQQDDDAVVGDLLELARTVATQLGIDQSGYRLVTNAGPDAGQTVMHLHVHLLGGERLHGFGA